MAEVTSIDEQLRSIIWRSLGGNVSEIRDTSRFDEDLDADSLDMIQITMDIEEEFHVEITDDEAAKVLTFGDAVRLVETKLGRAT